MRFQAVFSLTLIAVHSAPALEPKTSTKATSQVRQFSFPADYPLGTLKIMDIKNHMDRAIGPAKGNLTIIVPAGRLLLLDLNPHCLEHPERLKDIQMAGINNLKLSYLAMVDSDQLLCDKALEMMPECKDIFSLQVDRSDTTDKGLSHFKSLPSVKELTASCSCINGSVFKEPQKLKSLERLCLLNDSLECENLKYLGSIPHLKELLLNRSSLSDSDLSNLSKCTQLKILNISSNPKITDKSLPVLQGLTGLEILDVRDTGITFEGLLLLNSLKLKRLIITVRHYRTSEIELLKNAFPKTYIDYRGTGVAEDNKVYFGPLR